MNLLLLPKEIQILIGEYNIEHRPRMRRVMNELIDKHTERIEYKHVCVTCDNSADEQYAKVIFWNTYSFCSEYCCYDWESDMRKSYNRSLRR